MAFQKKKPKKIWTKQEQDWINEKLNASKRWHKPLKGQFIFKRDGSTQEVVFTARYNTSEELKTCAETVVEEMNSLDKSGHWTLVKYEIVGQDKQEDDDSREDGED